jgi:AraC-like DNA-binding protein
MRFKADLIWLRCLYVAGNTGVIVGIKRIAVQRNVAAKEGHLLCRLPDNIALNRILQADGLSVMRYAWSLRIERAAQRLVADASHGTIKRIAFQCGFKNHAHFSRVFKARYGMTPREYAAVHKKVHVVTAKQTQRHEWHPCPMTAPRTRNDYVDGSHAANTP